MQGLHASFSKTVDRERNQAAKPRQVDRYPRYSSQQLNFDEAFSIQLSAPAPRHCRLRYSLLTAESVVSFRDFGQHVPRLVLTQIAVAAFFLHFRFYC